MCEYCGIKITVAEGATCPGCGQSSFKSAHSTGNFDSKADKSSSVSSGNIESALEQNLFDENWSGDYFEYCLGLFDPERPHVEQRNITEQVIINTKEKLKTAPDKESEYRLYAYLSQLYRMIDNYQ